MRMLLVLASLGAIAFPSTAVAQSLVDQGFSVSVGSGRGDVGRVRGDAKLQGCENRSGQRGDRGSSHRGRRGSCGSTNTWIDAGEWALYNNRSWESDSYNDWWHDQPWRSYPRWVTKNEDCQRQWWSGGGWRC